jgi:hypothetical protein
MPLRKLPLTTHTASSSASRFPNCDEETNQTATSKYTREMEVKETWTVDTSIGVSLAGLSVLGGALVQWGRNSFGFFLISIQLIY